MRVNPNWLTFVTIDTTLQHIGIMNPYMSASL